MRNFDVDGFAEHFNGLDPAEHERLSILSEELGESQKAIGKILRHGYESHNPDDMAAGSNRKQLAEELGHVLYGIRELESHEDIDGEIIRHSMERKKVTIQPYLHHQ